MTQAQMAAALGVASNYVYLIESGRKPLTDQVRFRVEELEKERGRAAENLEIRETGRRVAAAYPHTAPGHGASRVAECRIPEGCDVAADLASLREEVGAMRAQIDTVIRLLGASLQLPATPEAHEHKAGRKAG